MAAVPSIFDHRVYTLASELRVSRSHALGILVGLHQFCVAQGEEPNATASSISFICKCLGYDGDPVGLLEALSRTGWVTVDGEVTRLHCSGDAAAPPVEIQTAYGLTGEDQQALFGLCVDPTQFGPDVLQTPGFADVVREQIRLLPLRQITGPRGLYLVRAVQRICRGEQPPQGNRPPARAGRRESSEEIYARLRAADGDKT